MMEEEYTYDDDEKKSPVYVKWQRLKDFRKSFRFFEKMFCRFRHYSFLKEQQKTNDPKEKSQLFHKKMKLTRQPCDKRFWTNKQTEIQRKKKPPGLKAYFLSFSKHTRKLYSFQSFFCKKKEKKNLKKIKSGWQWTSSSYFFLTKENKKPEAIVCVVMSDLWPDFRFGLLFFSSSPSYKYILLLLLLHIFFFRLM